MRLIAIGLLILVLTGCASTKPIEVSTIAVDKAPLILPAADNYYGREVKWVVITPENYKEVFAKLEKQGKNLALFALTDDGYEALALNFKDIQTILIQYQAIVAAYKEYYDPKEEPKQEETVEEPKKSIFDLF